MGFNDAANNRQPQPSTSLALTVTPPEPLKDELALGDGDSGTSIQDAHAAVLLDDNLDVGAVSRMVDGIFHKVANGRSQHFRIAADPDGSVGSSQDDVFALGHRKRRERVRHFGATLTNVGSAFGIEDKAWSSRLQPSTCAPSVKAAGARASCWATRRRRWSRNCLRTSRRAPVWPSWCACCRARSQWPMASSGAQQ